jgi:hypothetical protein
MSARKSFALATLIFSVTAAVASAMSVAATPQLRMELSCEESRTYCVVQKPVLATMQSSIENATAAAAKCNSEMPPPPRLDIICGKAFCEINRTQLLESAAHNKLVSDIAEQCATKKKPINRSARFNFLHPVT